MASQAEHTTGADRKTDPAPEPADTARSSVDRAEIARFDAMAAQWWSPDGPMAALHKMNPVRVAWICEQIERRLPAADGARRNTTGTGQYGLQGLSILDIGCGGGILSESLARLGADVTGLEPAEKNLAIARAHATSEGLRIDYRSDTAEALAAEGRQYDIVCAMEVVEHVVDVKAFIASAGAMVKPGGLFFAATLNRTLKSFALAIIGAEYVLRWVPQGTHQWEKFVTPKELDEAIAEAGLKPAASTGVVYNPLARNWRVARDVDVNYMLLARKKK